VFSWIGRKISREFERFLERSFQKTADRLSQQHVIYNFVKYNRR